MAHPYPTRDIPASFIGEKEISLELIIIPSFRECDINRTLLADMKANGQKTPINLSNQRTSEGFYRIADGNNRAVCAKLLGWKTVKAVCIS